MAHTNIYARPLVGEEKVITTFDGADIHTIAAGSGIPIVLAHGYASDMHCWNLVAESLVARNYKVIAFDQRGHGRSTIGSDGIGSRQMASDYLAVLSAYEVEGGVLVGHSMGGFVAIRALIEESADMADYLRGCLLLATFAGDVNRRNLQNRVQIALIRSGWMDVLIRNHSIALALAKSLLGDEKNPDMMNVFVEVFKQSNLKSLLPILNAFVKENRYSKLSEISVPCTIMVGEKDKTTPPFHTDYLHRGIQRSRLVRVPTKGHMLNWEAPEILVEEIARLAGTPRA
ncbi:MAG: alpha/beta fold hydrolase [Haliscomenobacter sp.]